MNDLYPQLSNPITPSDLRPADQKLGNLVPHLIGEVTLLRELAARGVVTQSSLIQGWRIYDRIWEIRAEGNSKAAEMSSFVHRALCEILDPGTAAPEDEPMRALVRTKVRADMYSDRRLNPFGPFAAGLSREDQKKFAAFANMMRGISANRGEISLYSDTPLYEETMPIFLPDYDGMGPILLGEFSGPYTIEIFNVLDLNLPPERLLEIQELGTRFRELATRGEINRETIGQAWRIYARMLEIRHEKHRFVYDAMAGAQIIAPSIIKGLTVLRGGKFVDAAIPDLKMMTSLPSEANRKQSLFKRLSEADFATALAFRDAMIAAIEYREY